MRKFNVLCLAAIVVAGFSNKAEAQAAAAPAAAAPAPDLCALMPVPPRSRSFCAQKRAAEEAAKVEKKCTDADGTFDAKKHPSCNFGDKEKTNCEAGLDDGSGSVSPGTAGIWNAKAGSCVFDGTRQDMGFCLPPKAARGEAPREIFADFACYVYDSARGWRQGSGGVDEKRVRRIVDASERELNKELVVRDTKIGELAVAVNGDKDKNPGLVAQVAGLTTQAAEFDKGLNGVGSRVDAVEAEAKKAGETVKDHGEHLEALDGHYGQMAAALGQLGQQNLQLVGLVGKLADRGFLFSVGPAGFIASGSELKATVGKDARLVRGSYLRGGGLSLGLDYLSGGPSVVGAFVLVSTATSDGANSSSTSSTFDGSLIMPGVQYLRALDKNWSVGGFAAFQMSRAGSLLLSPRASGMGAVIGLAGRGNLTLSDRFRLMIEPKLGLGYEVAAASVAVAGQNKPVSDGGLMLFGSAELRLGYKP